MPAPKINPKRYKKQVSIRTPVYLIDFMDSHKKCRADLIEEAMVHYYGLKVPDRDLPKKIN